MQNQAGWDTLGHFDESDQEGTEVTDIIQYEQSRLLNIEAATLLLAEAREIQEVTEIRNYAEAVRIVAKQAKAGLEAQNQAAELKLRAERRAGEMLASMDRVKKEDNLIPNAFYSNSQPMSSSKPKLDDLGVTSNQSSNWQRIAKIPQPEFERHIEQTKAQEQELTTASTVRLAVAIQHTGQPSKPYHANARTVGDQFHSKLIWNYKRLDLTNYDHFTIGYSQRTWDQIRELLELAGVNVLMDVRRSPISQYKPEFNKQALLEACDHAGISYVHAPELGIGHEERTDLAETQDYDGLFDAYEQRLTQGGIIEAIEKRADMHSHDRIAFMCVEIDPCTCHRHRISNALQDQLGALAFDL